MLVLSRRWLPNWSCTLDVGPTQEAFGLVQLYDAPMPTFPEAATTPERLKSVSAGLKHLARKLYPNETDPIAPVPVHYAKEES